MKPNNIKTHHTYTVCADILRSDGQVINEECEP
ncbi:hypothetical protein Dxin01_00144 [Deinococcus xinjiangensis]|uniref:Uncharacterized protein n=1 Tax=Deinococcus xinjiangensis TaxID=457454 RepID=A0ABP9VAX8_9DEIO